LATGLLLVGAPAFAQPPVTETDVRKNVVETFVEALPTCEAGAPLYTITTTTNRVEHTTTFDDGRIDDGFTATGEFVAVPLEDPSLPSFTGSFSVRGGFNQENEASSAPSPSASAGRARTGRSSPSTLPGTSTSGRTARSMRVSVMLCHVGTR